NEADKLLVNIGDRKTITEDDVERYVGVSKEYNSFELKTALAAKDYFKAIRIINYFDSNPKAGPIQLVLPTLYLLFSKSYMLIGLNSRDETIAASMIGIHPNGMKDCIQTVKNYKATGIEQALLLLHQYNLQSVGVQDSGSSGSALMKELVAKLMQCA